MPLGLCLREIILQGLLHELLPFYLTGNNSYDASSKIINSMMSMQSVKCYSDDEKISFHQYLRFCHNGETMAFSMQSDIIQS